MTTNAINWFEIPAADIDRAARFYGTIFGITLEPVDSATERNAFFPDGGGVGGSLTQADGYVPSEHGPVVYLNGGDDLNGVLGRVEAAGGSVLVPKLSIGTNGYIAFFRNTEGNRIGLHSLQ